MKATVFAAALLLLVSCGGGPRSGVSSVPGQGAITVQVTPNPIVAQRVSGDTYDFPFDIVVRETGGRAVNVTRVTVTVYGPGGLSLGSETWDADQIRARGHNTGIGANAEVRYHFAPRKSVPDDRLFGGISAELRVDAVDDTGAATNARTVVTITR